MERSARIASKEAVPEAREGSARSFDELLRNLAVHHHAVRRTLRAGMVPEVDLDNEADKVFDHAFEHWSEFDGGNLSAWLREIAKIRVKRYQRRAKWRRWLLGRFAAELPSPVAAGPDPEEAAWLSQGRALLDSALRQINPTFATAFVLFEHEQRSLAQIAEHEGISEATAKTRIYRAREELKRVMKKLVRDGGVR